MQASELGVVDEASQTYVVPNKFTLDEYPEELHCDEVIKDTAVSHIYLTMHLATMFPGSLNIPASNPIMQFILFKA